MASDYRKAVRPLKIEHELQLEEPDDVLHRVKDTTHNDYLLCLASKQLWLCDPILWNVAVAEFNRRAPNIRRAEWIPKPRGDSTALPHREETQIEDLKDLFRDCLGHAQANYYPSTDPFTTSQCLEIEQGRYGEDSQELPRNAALPVNHKVQFPPSSSDTYQPHSSWLDAANHPDAYAFAAADPLPRDSLDYEPMVVDKVTHAYTPQKDPQTLHHETNGCSREEEQDRKSLRRRKRPVSDLEVEDSPVKRHPSNDSLFCTPTNEEDRAHYSFTRSASQSATHSDRSRSRDTSFRSVTDVNDSFLTNNTSPSFMNGNGHIQLDILAFARKHSDTVPKKQAYHEYLKLHTPFSDHLDSSPADISFRVSHQVTRISNCNTFQPAELCQYLENTPELLVHPKNDFKGPRDIEDCGRLWEVCSKFVKERNGIMPPRLSAKVWKLLGLSRVDRARSDLCLSGVISLGETLQDPILNIKLNPISREKSCRFKRKYGSDRIMVLNIPGLESMDLPRYLKSTASDFKWAFVEWIATNIHHFLGRHWRAFDVKSKIARTGDKKPMYAWRVFLFATDGHGFKNYNDGDLETPQKVPFDQMINWFMSLNDNAEQPLLKLFSRLHLGVSDTIATLQFQPSQIIQGKDITVESPDGKQKIVMTDGCGLISAKAAQIVSQHLRLTPPFPSAFQARIAGAKGMWIVDPSPRLHNGSDIWIEILPSQTKFESLTRDEAHPDEHRTTFEIHDYSRSLRAAPVNFQLLPILIDRGVPAEVIIKILKIDLESKVVALEQALSEPQALRAWSQEQISVAGTRLTHDGVLWTGGMPDSDQEQINALSEAGFVPATCPYLRDICRNEIQIYCKIVEEKMNIYPGQATYAYMVPDFWGVLEEDEVHIGFSSNFSDKRMDWSDTMVHNTDVLVARLPAALPSDIHRVRAVFKTELAHLKDIIVFPTNGSFCLADKLSGGDYDGDRAWICWNSKIVHRFQNFPIPSKPDYEHYGIQKDETRMADILSTGDAASQVTEFVRRGFHFNIRRSCLGICTNAHEAFCYKQVLEADKRGSRGQFFSPMGDRKAVELAYLLGCLVDTAKNGFTFTDEDCNKYLKSIGALNLEVPIYKLRKGVASHHILDQLVMNHAIAFKQRALKRLDGLLKENGEPGREPKDKDLLKMLQDEKRESANDGAIHTVLQQLKRDVDDALTSYQNSSHKLKSSSLLTWSEIFALLRERFLSIMPASGVHNGYDLDAHPMIKRWRDSCAPESSKLLSTRQSWSLLKASMFYDKQPFGSFAWRSCGKELMALKLLANGTDVSVSRDIHIYLTFNRKLWENAKAKRDDREQLGYSIEEDLFDDLDLTDQDYETAYESQANAE